MQPGRWLWRHQAPSYPIPASQAGRPTACVWRACAACVCVQVLRLWGAILTAVPNSRLLLKNKPFACQAARAHVLRQLAAVGVEAWRVDLMPLAPGNAQHMATYGLMDISLDPFPYAGAARCTSHPLPDGVACATHHFRAQRRPA
jgi:protein O-GlcNAc transferase